nr:hypothetical protein [Kineococcus xinjiangensis]
MPAAVLAVVAAGLPAAPAAAAPDCGQVWGSQQEEQFSPSVPRGHVAGVRSGRHACFDRLVIDVEGKTPGYFARYVPEFRKMGSGEIVPLRGGAQLQVIVTVPAYDDAGWPTYDPARTDEVVPVAGYRTLRQVAWGSSFEGYTTLGLGVRARLPYRVWILDGPGDGSRLVVDVAHRW